ncbi:hypothetical protein BC834DRAFT_1045133 [Gloeopeniophorella convolvens]|nr:hypothetical protein BC834DRAFT_1045133 [Gloeopeniophorella convolvens]
MWAWHWGTGGLSGGGRIADSIRDQPGSDMISVSALGPVLRLSCCLLPRARYNQPFPVVRNAQHPIPTMSVLYTDYSRLFSAGLRVIESRRTPRRPHLAALSVLTHTSSHTSSDSPAPSPPPKRPAPAPWKRLWRRSVLPKPIATPAPAPTPPHPEKADPRSAKRARRRMMPARVVEDTALDVRIWDWSARVSRLAAPHRTAFPPLTGPRRREDDGPRDADRADPVLAPSSARTAILVALPAPACNDEGAKYTEGVAVPRRVSAQTLPVRVHPYRVPAPAAEDFWDSDSDSDDEEEEEEDAWRTFRVEWIDFD